MMRFHVRGDQLEVTDALRQYVEKKIGRLERYFNSPPTSEIEVYVTMKVTKDIHTVEVTIPLPGVLLRAQERNSDMYASIDLVVDKLERQIRKHKTKVNRKLRQESGLRMLFKETVENGAAAEAVQEEEEKFRIIRVKKFPLKPMDVEEAILRMNMVGHDFFVFNNMDTDQINVVYRRNDGNYGLIEPAN